ncbi:MAG: hypothetical protein K9J25_06665 [Bacteroidales bacterium]|nr:hypothetical protein [Bacteroidales bacterium]
MRKGFTLNIYRLLLETLQMQGISFMQVGEYYANQRIRSNTNRFVILRQDVDKLPGNSLAFAQIQRNMGIRSTFYFRVVPGSFDEGVIEEIAGLGHEIGYHYEDMSFVPQRQKTKDKRLKEEEIVKQGIESFEKNLERFRETVPVRSICMHGSPMSRWDSRLLWKYYDYREFGVDFEPYFDLNMESMLYLTDTGRRWNGSGVSIRDKAQSAEHIAQDVGLRDREIERRREKIQVEQGNDKDNLEPGTLNLEPFADWKVKPVSGSLMNMTKRSKDFQAHYIFRSTNDIIQAVEQGQLPDRIMMTFHPQRWTNKTLPWVKELLWQNTKNVAKYFLIKFRNK